MRNVIASPEGVTEVTNLPASAPPTNVSVASSSVFFGKFFVFLIYIADRA